jgi:hypothetical protein
LGADGGEKDRLRATHEERLVHQGRTTAQGRFLDGVFSGDWLRQEWQPALVVCCEHIYELKFILM